MGQPGQPGQPSPKLHLGDPRVYILFYFCVNGFNCTFVGPADVLGIGQAKKRAYCFYSVEPGEPSGDDFCVLCNIHRTVQEGFSSSVLVKRKLCFLCNAWVAFFA